MKKIFFLMIFLSIFHIFAQSYVDEKLAYVDDSLTYDGDENLKYVDESLNYIIKDDFYAKQGFVNYFSDSLYSKEMNRNHISLCYDQAIAKFGIGTAIIASTYLVSIVVPGGTVYQAAVLLIAKATATEAVLGGLTGGVISCAISLLKGESIEKVLHSGINSASDGFLIGAVTGLLSGGVKVINEAKNIADATAVNGSKIIFDGKIYDSTGKFVSTCSDDVMESIASKYTFIKDLKNNRFYDRLGKETDEILKKNPKMRSELRKLHEEMNKLANSSYRNVSIQTKLNAKLDQYWYALEESRRISYKITNYGYESSKFTASEIKNAIDFPLRYNTNSMATNPELFQIRYIRGENGIVYKTASANFKYMAEVRLPENLLKNSTGVTKKAFENMQFDYCTKELLKNSEKYGLCNFDKTYVMKTGCMPYDTVWHHDLEHGRMLLVSKADHSVGNGMGGIAHTGGDYLWNRLFPSGRYLR